MAAQQDGANRPWFTIIIPVYNAEKYLPACLDSIIQQDFTDFEVVLVNDGSTDASAEIAGRYAAADKRIRLFTKQNGGPFQARIYGAERARGEYILYSDADDFFVKHAFSTLYEKSKDKTWDLIQFGSYKKYNHITRRGQPRFRAFEASESEMKYKHYPKLLCSFYDDSRLAVSVWDKVYHRSLLGNLPPSEAQSKFFWGDDLVLNLHLLQTCRRALFIDQPLYVYRMGSGGTSIFRRDAMQDLNEIKRQQLAFLAQWDGKDREKVLDTLHSETAAWFFLYVQDCLKHLDETETETLIENILKLPAFVEAAAYYRANQQDWQAVELLRQGDPKAYIAAAKACIRKPALKARVRAVCKKILYNL